MDLAALEEIRRLKYRYLRCVDLKLWDEIADVFTPDATVDYGTRALGEPVRLSGREEIVAFLRDKLGPDIITVHFASQPEIDVDGAAATGTWSFEDTVIATEYRVLIKGAAFYEDRYARGEDGRVADLAHRLRPHLRDHDVAGRHAKPEVHREPLGGPAGGTASGTAGRLTTRR
jgi:SnoaL-like protein